MENSQPAMLSSLATAAGLSRPKKKFHFDVKVQLEELLNCTFLSGDVFAKIRLREGGTFSAVSNRQVDHICDEFVLSSVVVLCCSCDVRSHRVRWDQGFYFHCKMYASPVTGELEPCQCKISIRKVLHSLHLASRKC